MPTVTVTTVKKSCPHCKIQYKTEYTKGRYSIGSPILKCNYCGKSFYDASYKEPALYPKLFKKPHRIEGLGFILTGVFLLLVGILAAYIQSATDFVVFFYVISGLIGGFGIFQLIRSIKNYNRDYLRWEQKMLESRQRMSDPEYSKSVRELYEKDKQE